MIGCLSVKCILGVPVKPKFLCPRASCNCQSKDQMFSKAAVNHLDGLIRRVFMSDAQSNGGFSDHKKHFLRRSNSDEQR